MLPHSRTVRLVLSRGTDHGNNTGLTRTRVFVVFHDMAHHNYFSSKQANATIATLLGTFCYTPYTGWKKGHDYHHRHSNNTDRLELAMQQKLYQSRSCCILQTVANQNSHRLWHWIQGIFLTLMSFQRATGSNTRKQLP